MFARMLLAAAMSVARDGPGFDVARDGKRELRGTTSRPVRPLEAEPRREDYATRQQFRAAMRQWANQKRTNSN